MQDFFRIYNVNVQRLGGRRMEVRIEKVSGDVPAEAVIYCSKITREVERAARALSQETGTGSKAICYNEEERYYLTLSEVLTSIFPE